MAQPLSVSAAVVVVAVAATYWFDPSAPQHWHSILAIAAAACLLLGVAPYIFQRRAEAARVIGQRRGAGPRSPTDVSVDFLDLHAVDVSERGCYQLRVGLRGANGVVLASTSIFAKPDGSEHVDLRTIPSGEAVSSLTVVPEGASEDLVLDVELLHSSEADASNVSLVATRSLLLRVADAADGVINEVCPVIFDEIGHFCCANLVVRASPAKSEEDSASIGAPVDAARVANGTSAGPALMRAWPPIFAGGYIVRETMTDTTGADVAVNAVVRRRRDQELVGLHKAEDFVEARFLKREGSKLLYPPEPAGCVDLLAPAHEASASQTVLFERAFPGTQVGDTPAVHAGTGAGHLIVLVPGYLGKASDMKLLRNYLALLLPEARFATFSPSEDDAEDMHRASVRLAREVAECVDATEASSVSFVAHGTGGILARAALPWIQEHKDRLSALVTLDTPHLGLPCSALSWRSYLVLMLARTFYKGFRLKFLDQLALADGRRAEDSFVFRLCREHTVGLFKDIVLVSSVGGNVPVSSALFAHSAQDTPATGSTTEPNAEAAPQSPKDSSGGRVDYLWWLGYASSVAVLFVVSGAVMCAVLPWLQTLWPDFGWPTPNKRWPRYARLGLLGLVLIRLRLKDIQEALQTKGVMGALGSLASSCSSKIKDQDLEREMLKRALANITNNRLTRLHVHVQPDAVRGARKAGLLSSGALARLGGDDLHDQTLRSRPFVRTLTCAYAHVFRNADTPVLEGQPAGS